MESYQFSSKTTACKLNLSKVKFNSKLHHLITKLNCRTEFGGVYPVSSIMHYNQICDHDDGYLCEHRLQILIDYIIENFNEKL